MSLFKHGTSSSEILRSIEPFTSYYDFIFGYGGNDTIFGGIAQDTLYGGDPNPNIDAGSGNDYIYGDAGSDVILGQDGNDSLYGGTANDTIWGGSGNDILNGDDGNDKMGGGAGDDIYYVNSTSDSIVENPGEGIDSVYVNVNNFILPAEVDSLIIQGGISTATGNNISNTITGNAGTNTLKGVDGDDIIWGYNDNDNLQGGNGNDSLVGGMGKDILTGGAGPDLFVFGAHTGAGGTPESGEGSNNRDVITDFVVGDKIYLTPIDANLTLSGDQAFAQSQISYVSGIANISVIGGTNWHIELTGAPALNWTDVIL